MCLKYKNSRKAKIFPAIFLLDNLINNANLMTLTSTPPNFSEQGIPFIRATNIKEGRIVENDMKYISEEEAKKIEKCKLSLGDTIIVRSGANTGDNTFVPEKYVDCYGGYDIIVKLNEKKIGRAHV